MLFDGDYMRIYIDGSQVASRDTLLTDVLVNTNTLRIGRYTKPDPQYFEGIIDEVRI